MRRSRIWSGVVIFLIFLLVLREKIVFYSVNYYNKDGLCKQYIIPGFQDILPIKINQEIYTVKVNKNTIDIYKNYEIEVKVNGKIWKIRTNYSESIADVIDKIPVIKNRKFVIISSKNKKIRSNTMSLSLLIDKCKIYTRKDLIIVFNGKNYKVSYYDFYSEKDMKVTVIQALKQEFKRLGISRIKNINFVDLEEGFVPVSFGKFHKTLGVNVVFINLEKIGIPYERKVIYTSELKQGQKVVVRKGKKGRMLREYLVYIDYDGEKRNELVKTVILEDKQDEVVKIGIAPIVDCTGKNYYIMESTGYTAGIGGVGYCTCTGYRVKRGVVAVDPSIIPLGTKLYIEGYGYGIAVDKGSAIKGFKIDLYFETLEEAISWGRRKVKVFILGQQ